MHHTYLIENQRAVAVKIGISNNPALRLSQLRVSAPDSLELAHTWKDRKRERVAALERDLHRRLRFARVSGEWFKLRVTDIQSVGDAVWSGAATADRLTELLAEHFPLSRAHDEIMRQHGRATRWEKSKREALIEDADELLDEMAMLRDEFLSLGGMPDALERWEIAQAAKATTA